MKMTLIFIHEMMEYLFIFCIRNILLIDMIMIVHAYTRNKCRSKTYSMSNICVYNMTLAYKIDTSYYLLVGNLKTYRFM